MDAFHPNNVGANQNASKGSASANRATCSTSDSAVSYGSAGKSIKRFNPSLLLIDAKLTSLPNYCLTNNSNDSNSALKGMVFMPTFKFHQSVFD